MSYHGCLWVLDMPWPEIQGQAMIDRPFSDVYSIMSEVVGVLTDRTLLAFVRAPAALRHIDIICRGQLRRVEMLDALAIVQVSICRGF